MKRTDRFVVDPRDQSHNDGVDRRDAIRFRRLVQAALNNDVWFQRMAQEQHQQPRNLHEVREMIDYVIRMETSNEPRTSEAD